LRFIWSTVEFVDWMGSKVCGGSSVAMVRVPVGVPAGVVAIALALVLALVLVLALADGVEVPEVELLLAELQAASPSAAARERPVIRRVGLRRYPA
jgi:hypothetical protein